MHSILRAGIDADLVSVLIDRCAIYSSVHPYGTLHFFFPTNFYRHSYETRKYLLGVDVYSQFSMLHSPTRGCNTTGLIFNVSKSYVCFLALGSMAPLTGPMARVYGSSTSPETPIILLPQRSG